MLADLHVQCTWRLVDDFSAQIGYTARLEKLAEPFCFLPISSLEIANTMDAYTEAHLFVAAIRILTQRNASPPKLEDICELLNISSELGHTICRKLKKSGIISTIEDPFSINCSVGNHLDIEQLPREANKEDALAKELEQFQAKKQNTDQKVAALQAEMAKKRQDLFADLEAKFKKEMDKQKNG